MRAFWKERAKVEKDLLVERLANRLAMAIVRRQLKIAGWLERKTQYWNRSSKLIALVVFCLLFGGFCLWLLVGAFFKGI